MRLHLSVSQRFSCSLRLRTLPPLDGLSPDVEVETPDLETLRQGRDVYVETAVETLRNSPRW